MKAKYINSVLTITSDKIDQIFPIFDENFNAYLKKEDIVAKHVLTMMAEIDQLLKEIDQQWKQSTYLNKHFTIHILEGRIHIHTL